MCCLYLIFFFKWTLYGNSLMKMCRELPGCMTTLPGWAWYFTYKNVSTVRDSRHTGNTESLMSQKTKRQSHIPFPPHPHSKAERPANLHSAYSVSINSFLHWKFMSITKGEGFQALGKQFLFLFTYQNSSLTI